MRAEYLYLYLIELEDGRFYIGSRKSTVPPEEDTKYMGTPHTFRDLWKSCKGKIKTILRQYDDYSLLLKHEAELIKECWLEYGMEVCINRNAGGCMSVNGFIKRNRHEKIKTYHLVSPEGKVFKGSNLNQFCKEHNLDSRNIYRVIKGIQGHYKGWTQYKEAKKPYIHPSLCFPNRLCTYQVVTY